MIEKRDYFQLLLHFLLIVVLSLIQIIYPIFVSEILTVQSTVNSIFVIVCSLIVGKMIVNICDLPFRGGSWDSGSIAGVFAVNLSDPRSNSNHNAGFRSALLLQLGI